MRAIGNGYRFRQQACCELHLSPPAARGRLASALARSKSGEGAFPQAKRVETPSPGFLRSACTTLGIRPLPRTRGELEFAARTRVNPPAQRIENQRERYDLA